MSKVRFPPEVLGSIGDGEGKKKEWNLVFVPKWKVLPDRLYTAESSEVYPDR
jgi:hypothetical protein